MKFYSWLDCSKKPTYSNCEYFLATHKDIVFPCIILIRENGWNDYTFFSHFNAFFVPKEGEIKILGTVCIIQSNAPDNKTELPLEFENLAKREFFSRGKLVFYNNIESEDNLKKEVLSALNDIHLNHYSQEDIIKADPNLILPYTNSLFREDFCESDISSQYAKNSIDMLDKILSCLSSISSLEQEEQKVMKKLLFGSAVTSLESYLGDAFKYHVLNKENYYYSFLENYKFSTEKKYTLNDLGCQGRNMDEFLMNKVKEHLNNIIFHKVDLVTDLYKDILNIDLQSNLRDFRGSIQKRHDIFHRNGRDLSGEELDIRSRDIRDLVLNIQKFISETEKVMIAQIS